MQKLLLLLAQSGDPAGDSPGLCVFQNAVQHGFFVPVSQRPWIDAAAVKLGKQDDVPVNHGEFLPSPQVQIGKGEFASALSLLCQIRFVEFSVLQCNVCEVDPVRGVCFYHFYSHCVF